MAPLPPRSQTTYLVIPSSTDAFSSSMASQQEVEQMLFKTAQSSFFEPRTQTLLHVHNSSTFLSNSDFMTPTSSLRHDSLTPTPSLFLDPNAAVGSAYPTATGTYFNRLEMEPNLVRQIFMYCLPPKPDRDSMVMPNTLQLVCKSWHYLVLDSPELWTSVYHSRKTPTRPGAEPCLITPEIAIRRVMRSRNRPMDICIALRGPEDVKMFLIICSAAKRWRHIRVDLWATHELGLAGRVYLLSNGMQSYAREELTGDREERVLAMRYGEPGGIIHATDLFYVLSPSFNGLLPDSTPLLESFSVDCGNRVSDLSRWLNSVIMTGDAPRFKSLEWKNLFIVGAVPNVWTVLTNLSLCGTRLSPESALNILFQATNLVELSLEVGDPWGPSDDYEPLDISPEQHTIHLSHLRDLKLSLMTYDNFLDFLDVPALENFYLEAHILPDQELLKFANRSQSNLNQFHLRSFSLYLKEPDENSTETLRRFLLSPRVEKSLHSISIQGLQLITDELLDLFSLSATKLSAGGAIPIFSKLENFLFTSCNSFALSPEYTLTSVMQSRSDAGLPVRLRLEYVSSLITDHERKKDLKRLVDLKHQGRIGFEIL